MYPVLIGGCLFMLLAHGLVAVEVDPAISEYQPVAGLSGNLNSVGSDTLNNLMTFWAEEFQKRHSTVNVQIEGKGGESAPVALANGNSQIAPMAREMVERELVVFDRLLGYRPTRIVVALDALAVFVHPDNPVASLSLVQLDQIYSTTFKRGGVDVTDWGGLGLTGEWSAMPITLFGRNSASGAYGVAHQRFLMSGTFKKTVQEKPGSSILVTAVAKERGSIGYSGVVYLTPAVRPVPIADGDQPAIAPTYDQILAGKYPLSRFLYLYINQKPGAKADSLVTEFIRFVLSKTGQQIVIKDGYLPLSAAMVAEQHALLAP